MTAAVSLSFSHANLPGGNPASNLFMPTRHCPATHDATFRRSKDAIYLDRHDFTSNFPSSSEYCCKPCEGILRILFSRYKPLYCPILKVQTFTVPYFQCRNLYIILFSWYRPSQYNILNVQVFISSYSQGTNFHSIIISSYKPSFHPILMIQIFTVSYFQATSLHPIPSS